MLALCEYELRQDDAALRDIRAAKRLGIQEDEQLEQVMAYHEAMLLRKGMYESADDVLGFFCKKGVRSRQVSLALGMSVLLMRPSELPPEGSSARGVVVHIGEAESLRIIQKSEEARQAYQELVKAYPTFPNIHYAYGRFLLAVREPDEAVPQFEEEIKNNPSHTRARLQIAAVHYRVNSAAGIAYAGQAVKLQPGFPFGHYLLGLLYLDTGDAGRALTQLEIAAKMAPHAAACYFALGSAYAKVGRKQDAARARAAFLRLNRENSRQSGPASDADQNGSPLEAWEAMGRPDFPTPEQAETLRRVGQLPAPQVIAIPSHQPAELSLTLAFHALALVEIRRR